MLRGLDVSSYQGAIDWPAVAAAGYRFTYVKIAEGLSINPDSRAAFNVAEARKAGLVIGGYFFLHVERDIPTQLALHKKHAEAVGFGLPGDLPAACDLESPEKPAAWPGLGLTPQLICDRALVYMAGMKSWSPRQTPLLYTDLYYWTACQGVSDARFQSYALWAASYNVLAWPIGNQKPLVFRPWTTWSFWQWSDSARIPGVSVPIDADVFWGDETDMLNITKPDVVSVTELDDPAMGVVTDIKG
jgi:lysozyme